MKHFLAGTSLVICFQSSKIISEIIHSELSDVLIDVNCLKKAEIGSSKM